LPIIGAMSVVQAAGRCLTGFLHALMTPPMQIIEATNHRSHAAASI